MVFLKVLAADAWRRGSRTPRGQRGVRGAVGRTPDSRAHEAGAREAGRFPFIPSAEPTSEQVCERGGRPWWRAPRGDSPKGPHVPPLCPRLCRTHSPPPEMAEFVQKCSRPEFERGSFSAGVSGCSRVLASGRGWPRLGCDRGSEVGRGSLLLKFKCPSHVLRFPPPIRPSGPHLGPN